MRKCTECGKDLPNTEEFFSVRKTTNGVKYLNSKCRECKSAISKRWREENRDRYLETLRLWRERNNEYAKDYGALYYEENKDALIQKSINWRRSNPSRARWIVLKSTFQIDPLTIMDIMNDQRGACAICGCDLVVPESKTSYSVDHSHSTGEVRGLLCMRCNHLIGNSLDNREILLSAIDYLDKHKGTNETI